MSICPPAPKYNRLYDAFGWDSTGLRTLPADHRRRAIKKLCKRCGHSSYEDLSGAGIRDRGSGKLCCTARMEPGGQSVRSMSLPELVEKLLIIITSANPRLSLTIGKLRWMNGEYIKKMDSGSRSMREHFRT